MPSSADVAVIVCSRNRAHMLRDALAAIAESTPADTAVLVVDSASDTDDTREVAQSAGVSYVRAGRGLSVARNVGITTADRPIVVFTDDDCLPTAGWIERLAAGFDDPDVGAVTGRMLDHHVAADAPYHRQERYSTPISGIDAGHGAVMAFRRELLLRLGGFDDVLGAGQKLAGAEDLDIFVRILRAGSDVVHDGKCVVRHANTRVGDEYVALHRGYGLGLGALVGKWLRRDPAFGIRLGARLGGRTLRRIVRSARRRKPTAADRALLGGIVAGAWDVRRLPLVGERFVPPWSSETIPVLRSEGVPA